MRIGTPKAIYRFENRINENYFIFFSHLCNPQRVYSDRVSQCARQESAGYELTVSLYPTGFGILSIKYCKIFRIFTGEKDGYYEVPP